MTLVSIGTPEPATQRSPPRSVVDADPIPTQARAKFVSLQGQAADARDAANSAQSRHSDLRHQLDVGATDGSAAGIEIELSRLHQVRTTQNSRHGELSSLCAHLRQWLQTLPPNTSFDLAKPVAAKLLKDETLVQAIARVRDSIVATRQHLRAIQSAPLPKADLKAEARVYVQGLAQLGRPKISGNGAKLSIVFADANSFTSLSVKNIFQMQCWLHADEMVAAIAKEIDALPEARLALSVREKTKRLSELKAALDMHERMEEALIEKAIVGGLDVLRRTDADPLAVLGLMFRNKIERVRLK